MGAQTPDAGNHVGRGRPTPESIASACERGERLAERVAEHKSLLILDGLEPLQYPPGLMRGQLKDPALASLLTGLCRANRGLCVITTRQAVAELASVGTEVLQIELRALEQGDGALLLERLGVNGSTSDRASVAARLAGHALSIILMGTFLSEVHNGDITFAESVALLDQDAESGSHARHVRNSIGDQSKMHVAYSHRRRAIAKMTPQRLRGIRRIADARMAIPV